MTPWDRIDQELDRKGKSWKWLGEKIDFKPARMGNWRERGVPAAQYVAIADALEQSVDWLLGRATKQQWPFEELSYARWEKLTERQKGRVEKAAMMEIQEIDTEAAFENVVGKVA